MNPKVDLYLNTVEKWRDELEQLRSIVLYCGLSEELKWNSPCYTFQDTNVVIIGGLKDYCVLSFFKGALLADEQGILTAPGENTQSARVVPFTSVRQITDLEPVLKAYIYEAIEVEKAGLKVDFRGPDELEVPAELQSKLEELPALKTAFDNLTPGRQKAYLLYFAAAKQSKTRTARVEKAVPAILRGKGLNE